MKHTTTQKRNRAQNLVAGAGTILDVFPSRLTSLRRTAFRHVVVSDRDALRSDWQSIGEDFAPGLRTVTGELSHSREVEHVG